MLPDTAAYSVATDGARLAGYAPVSAAAITPAEHGYDHRVDGEEALPSVPGRYAALVQPRHGTPGVTDHRLAVTTAWSLRPVPRAGSTSTCKVPTDATHDT